ENFQQQPLAAFKADNDRATLLSAMFREYYRVELPSKVPVKKWLSFLPPSNSPDRPAPGSAARNQLDPAILEWQWHRGRVILITTTVNIDWGSWPGSPAFLPFMHELTRHAALGAPPRVVAAGEPLMDYLTVRYGLDGKIATPDGREVDVTLQDQGEFAVVRFPETDQSGIYRLTLGGSPREYLFAVNVPTATATAVASESDLGRVNPGEVEASGHDGDVQVVTDLREIQHKTRAVPAS